MTDKIDDGQNPYHSAITRGHKKGRYGHNHAQTDDSGFSTRLTKGKSLGFIDQSKVIGVLTMTATETTRAAQNEERETVVTTFPDSYAKDKIQDRFTLTALAVRLDGSEAVETKADCVFIKMAEFGDKPSPKVISVSGCEVDYDDGVMTFDDAEAILIANDIGCLLYTSASHTDEKPRWRGLFPFTQGITGTTEHMR
jgi:hypothetical protein